MEYRDKIEKILEVLLESVDEHTEEGTKDVANGKMAEAGQRFGCAIVLAQAAGVLSSQFPEVEACAAFLEKKDKYVVDLINRTGASMHLRRPRGKVN